MILKKCMLRHVQSLLGGQRKGKLANHENPNSLEKGPAQYNVPLVYLQLHQFHCIYVYFINFTSLVTCSPNVLGWSKSVIPNFNIYM